MLISPFLTFSLIYSGAFSIILMALWKVIGERPTFFATMSLACPICSSVGRLFNTLRSFDLKVSPNFPTLLPASSICLCFASSFSISRSGIASSAFWKSLNASFYALTQYDDMLPLFIQSCVLHFRKKDSLILTRSVKFLTSIYMLKESLSMHHY